MLVCANFHNWLGIETVLNTIPNINIKWGYVLYHFRIYYAGISYKYTIDLISCSLDISTGRQFLNMSTLKTF